MPATIRYEGTASKDQGGEVKDYIALCKPRVMGLSLFTALTAMMLSPMILHPFLQVVSLLSIAMGAAGAGVLNMWYEADSDGVMERTRNRPIPQGSIAKEEALAFGVILSFGALMILGLASSWFASFLLFFTILFYVGIYTIGLKTRTPQNIVIGGGAGALPPVVGWVASGGGLIDPTPWLLFTVIFLWTPSHFWALALEHGGDYAKAKIPTLPAVKGVEATKRQIFIYSALLCGSSLWFYPLGVSGIYSSIIIGVISFVFSFRCYMLLLGKDTPKGVFMFSIAYLFAVFMVLLMERSIEILL